MNDELIPQQATIDSALYIIDKIRPEIEKGSFRAIYRYTRHLSELVKFAAIVEERNEVGRSIIHMEIPDDNSD